MEHLLTTIAQNPGLVFLAVIGLAITLAGARLLTAKPAQQIKSKFYTDNSGDWKPRNK